MILIAPDKFKGTYTSGEVCRLFSERLRLAGIDVPIKELPLSDGGEGIADVLMPKGRLISSGVYEDGTKRLVVSSEIIGFEAFKDSNLPLMHRSSFMLGKAIERGKETIIAVGGTAISDGGAGFLQSLGVKFYDANNNLIHEHLTPALLPRIARAETSELAGYKITGIIDVKASLTESPLSALDFAAQKALQGEDLSALKDALEHFHDILGGSSQWDGAGGGVGYAIASVIGAECYSGAEVALDKMDIDWSDIELVITGEGRVDEQTVRGGKLVDAVYKTASSKGIPTLIVYGAVSGNLPYPYMAQIEEDWENCSLVRNLMAR